jgi:hypothetical protein
MKNNFLVDERYIQIKTMLKVHRDVNWFHRDITENLHNTSEQFFENVGIVPIMKHNVLFETSTPLSF